MLFFSTILPFENSVRTMLLGGLLLAFNPSLMAH